MPFGPSRIILTNDAMLMIVSKPNAKKAIIKKASYMSITHRGITEGDLEKKIVVSVFKNEAILIDDKL